ncbi:MAG: HAMP domain-containing histidine kinase, partial [Bdellovibrionales bacterium]|nr:HAMP domain-containing histidine kinase [Bdellovibrionales bacterium]
MMKERERNQRILPLGVSSLSWFFRLRLFSAVSQLALIGCSVFFLDVALPLIPLVMLVALIPLSQLLVNIFHSRLSDERILGASLLLFDTLILTSILSFSGGAANPFSIVYFLHVVLSALLLGKKWTWFLAGVTVVCFGMLFLEGGHAGHSHMGHGNYSIHLAGMFFSYCLVVLMSAYFLGKIIDELRTKEARLYELESKQNALLSMTALSANAAHELSTPLATIELVAHELQSGDLQEAQEDLALLKQEAQRCKQILSEICSQSGTPKLEPSESLRMIDIKTALLNSMPVIGDSVIWEISSEDLMLTLPIRSLVIALKSLIQNALDATSLEQPPVKVTLDVLGNTL